MKTYLTYGATWLLSSMLLWLEVNIFEINAWLAPVINLLVTIPLNFFLNKYWAFR
jgi:putative flippase GtrA